MENFHKKSELGRKGESVAAQFLVSKGYRILKRNWRFKKKEIDIIAEDDQYLVIAEVKSRTGDYGILPRDMVTRKKQRYLIEAAEAYIMAYDINKACRFDVILIFFYGGQPRLEYIPDAFHPGL